MARQLCEHSGPRMAPADSGPVASGFELTCAEHTCAHALSAARTRRVLGGQSCGRRPSSRASAGAGAGAVAVAVAVDAPAPSHHLHVASLPLMLYWPLAHHPC